MKEETAELTRRYEELRERVSHSYSRMQHFLDAERMLMDDQRRLVEYTRRLYSQRQEGSQQMKIAAVELNSIFKWLLAAILTPLGLAVGASVLGFFTAGLALPLAVAAAAGGVGAGVTYMRKKVKENESLTAANNWILEKDRPLCQVLLNIDIIDNFETHLNEVLASFHDNKAMDTHFRQKRIDVEKLQECFNELSEISRRWRRYRFGSQSEADIKRAEDAVRTYLQKNEYGCDYLNAVTLFLDLEKIGATGYDVAHLKQKKPPIRELLMIIAEGLLKDAAPAAELAKDPWRIRPMQHIIGALEASSLQYIRK